MYSTNIFYYIFIKKSCHSLSLKFFKSDVDFSWIWSSDCRPWPQEILNHCFSRPLVTFCKTHLSRFSLGDYLTITMGYLGRQLQFIYISCSLEIGFFRDCHNCYPPFYEVVWKNRYIQVYLLFIHKTPCNM